LSLSRLVETPSIAPIMSNYVSNLTVYTINTEIVK
jgi:hypothetical protein